MSLAQEGKSHPGRAAKVLQGVMLAIVWVIYCQYVRGKRRRDRITVPEAIDLALWLLRRIALRSAHFGLSEGEVRTAEIPSESYWRRLFQKADALLQPRLDEATLHLASHVEALLPKKTNSCHALWQLDGQFMTVGKLNEYLRRSGYEGPRVTDFQTAEVDVRGSVYILRAVDVASHVLLGYAILGRRANQLDVARFILELNLEWGLPLEIRLDLAGEHIAFGLYEILNQRLGIGLQYKSNRSAKLNSSVEVAHDIHSLDTVKSATKLHGFLQSEDGRRYVASMELYAVAADSARLVRMFRPMCEMGQSRAEKLAELPAVGLRHISSAVLRSVYHFDWVRRIDQKEGSFQLGGYKFDHPHLKFYQKVKIRFFPSYAGDWFEVRHYTSEEVLFKWKLS